MKFLICKVCGAAHKRRSIGTGRVVYCERCHEAVCSVHTSTVKRPARWVGKTSYTKAPELHDYRFCKLCLAEEALTA